MTALERDSEDRFVHWLAGQGFKAWKLRIDGQDGFPDRTVVTDRGVTFFEFKKPGESLLGFDFGGETEILRSEVTVRKTARPSLAPIPELVPELATA